MQHVADSLALRYFVKITSFLLLLLFCEMMNHKIVCWANRVFKLLITQDFLISRSEAQRDRLRGTGSEGQAQGDRLRGTGSEGHTQRDRLRGTGSEGQAQRDRLRVAGSEGQG